MAWEKLGSTTVGGSSDPVNNSWKELDRVTLGGAGNDLDTSTFTTKDNIMILANPIWNSGNPSPDFRFNGDSGSNYARRISEGGGSDATATSQAEIYTDTWGGGASSGMHSFEVMNLSNISAQEKLITHNKVYNRAGVGAGSTPNRVEAIHKWANTSAQINRVQLLSSVSNAFATGSEIVVLGCDNDEADSGTNFWQELSSTVLTATHSGALTVPQFTTKKYLMIRYYINSSTDCFWKVGTGGSIDSGNNYNNRYSSNGAGDSTLQYTSFLSHNPIVQGEVFIINKSDKEKLIIQHEIGQNQGSGAGGSGAGNVSNRQELVGKWANTSGQIDTLQYDKSGVSFYAGTTIKVYGAD